MPLSKCEFFIYSGVYLGHEVSENGIERDPEKNTVGIVNTFIYHFTNSLVKIDYINYTNWLRFLTRNLW